MDCHFQDNTFFINKVYVISKPGSLKIKTA